MDNKTLVSKIATNVINNYKVIYHNYIYPAAILNKSSITFILNITLLSKNDYKIIREYISSFSLINRNT
jgi:hypothetical protein